MAERMVVVEGAELWVTEQGVGEPLVLCTGGPGCCDYLGPVAAMVDDLVRVVRFEQIPGAVHDLWLTHDDEVRGLLRGFLAEGPARRS